MKNLWFIRYSADDKSEMIRVQNATNNELFWLRAKAWKLYFDAKHPTNQFGQRLKSFGGDEWIEAAHEIERMMSERGLNAKDKTYKTQPKANVGF